MRNVIIGTAGHVDHGKTCLIKALTGVDTDRLIEEKKRGITIELGFANMPNDSGFHIGIIDVPGHEKFVKNMLSGIGGIDLVLLVVSLDEGVMPQTREHFEILKMLGIKEGIIVFTKSDIADPDIVSMVEDDVTKLVSGSFMENSARIKVSSYTGENIDSLKGLILEKLKKEIKRREDKELMRLPIDRVFTMEGFGTVVTGTLIEGSVEVGDSLQIYPTDEIVKIRQIQSHNKIDERAVAGQRTALNLLKISKDELFRGQVLAYPDSMLVTNSICVELKLFEKTPKKLKNNSIVHFNYGSEQTKCRVVLLYSKTNKTDYLEAGESAFANLRFEEPIALKRGDKFIVRFFSPVITFGGGTVLDTNFGKIKKSDLDKLPAILEKLSSPSNDIVAEAIMELCKGNIPDIGYLSKRINLTKKETEKLISEMVAAKKVKVIEKNYCVLESIKNEIANYSTTILEQYQKENPIHKGMPKGEFLEKLSHSYGICVNSGVDKKAEALLTCLIGDGRLKMTEGFVFTTGFDSTLTHAQVKMISEIEKIYLESGIEVPPVNEVTAKYKDPKIARQMINMMAEKNILKKLDNNTYLHLDNWNKALEVLYGLFKIKSQVTLADFRTAMNTSRKYALIILEACDFQRITKLENESRTLIGGK